MVEEGFVKLRRCCSTWELRETRGGAAHCEFLRRPYRLRGCSGQERGPVVPLGFLDCFKVGCPSGSCRCKECRIEPVCLGGAEGGVISSPELREEVGPPRFRPERHPLDRGVVGQHGRAPVRVAPEPDVH